MLGTKTLALRRSVIGETNSPPTAPEAARTPTIFRGLLLGSVLLLVGATARAERLPLPANEQTAVNHAIDRGVSFLKATQLKSGTWALPKGGHEVGFAVLPGLTLLECGVPADDPVVKRAARFLRNNAAKLDTTYELSLGILFLDRLGDPRDRKLIQTFAMRLIAGQSATGGWGYKCPVLPGPAHLDLLTALRRLDPPPAGIPVAARNPPNMPGVAVGPNRKPGDLGPIAAAPGRKPGDLAPIAAGPGRKPGDLALITGPLPAPTKPSLSGTTTGSSPGESPGQSLGASLYPSAGSPGERSQWRTWLGTASGGRQPPDEEAKNQGKANGGRQPPDGAKDPGKANGGRQAPDAAKNQGADAPRSPAKPPARSYILPERLKVFPVLQDPKFHLLQDPEKRSSEWLAPTTDNSNTQFAILALWVAQRHDVPMVRTLKLIVRRFETSQNADGSWGYHYRYGGNEPERPPMTGVGLLGLAVGHGLAPRDAGGAANGGKPVQDPRILNGLVALSKNVGTPADRMFNLPMANLYFLWTVERVAVLYNLPTIGNKDWYRWGAQVLVANQDVSGNWKEGGYHGAKPAIDTCLALLFLKRANLVNDLTARLPFKAADLNKGVIEKLTPPPKPPEKVNKTLTPQPPKPAREAAPPDDNLISKPLNQLGSTTTRARTPEEAAVPNEDSGSRKKWIALCITVAVLMAGGSVYIFLVGFGKKKDKDRQPRKAKGKRKGKTTAPA